MNIGQAAMHKEKTRTKDATAERREQRDGWWRREKRRRDRMRFAKGESKSHFMDYVSAAYI